MKSPDSPQPLTLTEAIIPVASLIAAGGAVLLPVRRCRRAGARTRSRSSVADDDRPVHRLAPRPFARVPRQGRDGKRRHRHQRDLHPVRRRRADRHLGDERHAGRDGLLRAAAPQSELLLPDRLRDLRPSSSISIGSSWTVVGTIGIGFMGIAVNMGLNPAIAAGAVISGAYFGDKSSPLSDSANLAAAAAGVGLYVHLRETAADLAGGRWPSRWRCSSCWASPATTTPPPRWTAITERVSHLPGAVPAARGGRRARRC